MKFIHISDTHFGAFSMYEKVHARVIETFINILDTDADFIVIAGDFFNTPFQTFEGLNNLISSMKSFVQKGKYIYAVPGSHDRSSGISLFDILDAAGIIKNIAKYEDRDGRIYLLPTVDEKTGVHLYGIGGETNSREVDYFKKIIVNPERGSIFVFHSPIKDSIGVVGAREIEISDMPKGFSYYAGGHVHRRMVKEIGGAYLVYPGTFFASSFDELYNTTERGYAVVEDFRPRFVDLDPVKISRIDVDCSGKPSQAIVDEIINIAGKEQADITFINLKGKVNFNPEEINLGKIPARLKKKSTIFLRKKELLGEQDEEAVIDNVEIEIRGIKNPFKFDTVDFSEKMKIEREEGEKIDDFKQRLINSLQDELKMVEGHDNKGS